MAVSEDTGPLVSADWLADALQPGERARRDRAPVVIDCRFSLADATRGETAWRDARIPGAHYAHLERDLSSPPIAGRTGRHPLPVRSDFVERLQHFGIDSDTPIVAYDDAGGAFAARFWWLCRWIGHARVAVLDGGWNAWIEAGGRVDRAPPDASPTGSVAGRLDARHPLVDTVGLETIARDLEAGASPSLYLVDAREADRYRGEREPIDPVAGHIPGAVNCPFTGNLDANGRFLDRDALRRRYEPLLEAAGDRRPVLYCGSGVTAAHALLAIAHAGLAVPALYVGSFSEWATRDGGRYPVAPRDD